MPPPGTPRCSTRPSGGAGRRTGATLTQRFLAGCVLAKAALARYAARWRTRAFTGPCARAASRTASRPFKTFEHSVAHSGDLVAVAVVGARSAWTSNSSRGRPHPLGGGGDPDALARRALRGRAGAPSPGSSPDGRARAFLVAWTRKEAVTKATGDGLRAAFSEVVVAAQRGPPRVAAWPYPRSPRDVSLLDLDAAAGYVAALAVIGRCEAVRARDGSALLADLSRT